MIFSRFVFTVISLLFLSVHADAATSIHSRQYFGKYDSLRVEEKWEDIISLGLQELSDPNSGPVNRAQIHSCLSSCYFYLGQIEEVKKHALECYALSRHLDPPDLLIRSLYLLSAHYRTTAEAEDDQDKKRFLYQESKKFIEEALDLIPRTQSDYIVANVFFHAGALYTDNPEGDLNKATAFYRESMYIFKNIHCTDDYNRVAIRQARVYMIQGSLKKAYKLLDQIEPTITKKGKTLIHFRQAKAKVHLASAMQLTELALKQAEEMNMQKDITRLQKIRSGLLETGLNFPSKQISKQSLHAKNQPDSPNDQFASK